MRSLCVFVLISPIIVKTVKKFGFGVLPLLLGFYLAANPGHVDIDSFWVSSKWRSFWRLGFSVEGLFYFTLGACLNFKAVKVHRTVGVSLGLWGLVLGCVRMILKIKGYCDYGYLVPCAIPFVMIGVWSIVPTRKWSSSLVSNAFPIYVSHALLITVFCLVVRNLPFKLDRETGIPMLIEFVVIVFGSMMLAYGLRRLLPCVAKVIYGGR